MVALRSKVLPADLAEVVLHQSLDVNAQCLPVGRSEVARFVQGHSVELNTNPLFIRVPFITHDQAPPLPSARTSPKSAPGVQTDTHRWQTVT